MLNEEEIKLNKISYFTGLAYAGPPYIDREIETDEEKKERSRPFDRRVFNYLMLYGLTGVYLAGGRKLNDEEEIEEEKKWVAKWIRVRKN